MRNSGRLRIAAILAATAMVAAPVAAQRGTSIVAGVVRDSLGAPVSVATVTVGPTQSLTDSAGRFTLSRLPAGTSTVSVRRLGFRPVDVVVDLVDGRRETLNVTLVMLPLELKGLTTTAESRLREYLSDYYRHKAVGIGRFYDRATIDAMHVAQLTDVLRRVPGVRVVLDRSGALTIRMGRNARDCPPDFWVDNVRAYAMSADDMPLMDIEAIEIYAGPAGLPPEFINRFGNPACGAVVIWTRMPG